MSLHEALSSRTSACLVVANLLAWSGWFAMRSPYGELECASLRAHREARDLASARGELSPSQDTEGDRLIFGRPIHAAGSEPLHFRVLYAANYLPLEVAWSFVVPSGSRALGPTCPESRVCGVLFLILSALQWIIIGAVISSVLEAVESMSTRRA
jgi:hypothetical protein